MSHSTPAAAYDPVAELYDRAFSDIRVRRVEWRWLSERFDALPVKRPRVLEIGCGSGALLRALSPRVGDSVGVDVSSAMIGRAQARAAPFPQLSFVQVSDSRLPFAAGAFDVVVSFLSFRYLDWERIWPEIRRVLKAGGAFLMIDLVNKRARVLDGGKLVRSAIRHVLAPLRAPSFARELEALTSHPAWKDMLLRHPMRPLRAYQRFFAERLPGRQLEALDVLPARRIVALDSGPLGP